MIVKPTIKPSIKSIVPIKKNIHLVKDTISVVTSSVAIDTTKTENENKLIVKENLIQKDIVSQSNQIEIQKPKGNKQKEIDGKPKKKQKLRPLELPIIKASTTNLNGYNLEPDLELK
jgi:hypothetical protein